MESIIQSKEETLPTLNVTLWGKYRYTVEVRENPSMHELAWAIALEVHEQEGKTKFTDKPRTYNYILECLLRKTAFNFRFNTNNPTPDARKELYAAATELTNKTQAIKVKCLECGGEGSVVIDVVDGGYEVGGIPIEGKCSKCNGHGFLIERNMYRVGKTFNNRLVIDIDSHNEENLRDVKGFYEKLFNCEFTVFKTNGGYWLFSDEHYDSVQDFKFAHCRVLNPDLKYEDMNAYIKGLMSLDKKEGGIFKGATAEDIRKSGFYHGHGNFDIAFTFLSIKRERSTIRESKKHKDDKIVEVII